MQQTPTGTFGFLGLIRGQRNTELVPAKYPQLLGRALITDRDRRWRLRSMNNTTSCLNLVAPRSVVHQILQLPLQGSRCEPLLQLPRPHPQLHLHSHHVPTQSRRRRLRRRRRRLRRRYRPPFLRQCCLRRCRRRSRRRRWTMMRKTWI